MLLTGVKILGMLAGVSMCTHSAVATLAGLHVQANKTAECRHFIAPLLVLGHDGTFLICALAGDLTSGRTAIFGIICAMLVYVVALDGVFDLGLSAILDAFQTANELIQMTGLAGPQFEFKIVGV